MARPRRTSNNQSKTGTVKQRRGATVSELDEYIHLGEDQDQEEDLFDDVPDDDENEDDAAPIPKIERDTKLEQEIEEEKFVPIEKLIEDVPELGDSVDPVRLFLRDIGRHPLLTGEQELYYAELIAKGVAAQQRLDEIAESGEEVDLDQQDELELIAIRGKEAHNILAQCNLRLVVSVAKRYIGRGLNFLDLIQEGNIGLLRAVDKFDHTLGYKFSTYATWWIRQAISRAIADQARTIRIPVHMVETINRQRRIQRQLQQDLGREPLAEELAMAMEFLEPADVSVVKQSMTTGMSLESGRRTAPGTGCGQGAQDSAIEPRAHQPGHAGGQRGQQLPGRLHRG